MSRHRPRALLGSVMHARVAQASRRSLFASVQRGSATIAAAATSGTATITAVDLANSSIRFLGYESTNPAADGGNDPSVLFPRIELTNTTTVTAYRTTADATYGRVCKFEVTQYVPGVLKSVQRGTISVTVAATSGTATITAVDTTKSELGFLGFTETYGTVSNNIMCSGCTLTNATTVTTTTGNAAANPVVVGYEVREWF